MANEVKEVYFFPFGFICPPKTKPKPTIPSPINVYHSDAPTLTTPIHTIFGNRTDKFDPEETYAYLVADSKVTTNIGLILIEDYDIFNLMENPHQPWAKGGIVKLRTNGQVVPAFIPLLSDLKLLPKALQVTTRWALKKGEPEIDTLRLLSMVTPTLPAHRPVAVFTGGSRVGEHYSHANALYLFKTPLLPGNPCSLSVEWADNSNTWHDGRNYCVKVCNKGGDLTPCKDIAKPYLLVLVWNCKGITRPSFVSHLNHLIESHFPDIIVLTEVRSAEPLVRVMMRDINFHRVKCIEANITGGVVTVIMPAKVDIVPQDWCPTKTTLNVISRD